MFFFQVVCLGLLASVARPQELQSCSVPPIVGSTEEAFVLATSLHCSSNGYLNFDVQWVGKVFVDETIVVTNGASLNITGAGPGAIADGRSTTQMFHVYGGSTLHLSDMTLAHGNASDSDDTAVNGIHGGAIYVNQSSVSFSGNTSFISNSAKDYGGAIYASGSNVSWDGGGTQFTSNSANRDGGAIYASSSNVSWDGDGTQFGSNSANRGGAIYASRSSVSWDGDDTQFSSNSAESSGGAITVFASNLSWDGDDTQFGNNSARSGGGGAIYVHTSNVSWDGDDTQFSSNSAIFESFNPNGDDETPVGGAMYCGYGSIVSWDGDGTQFSSNSADYGGGAIYASSSNVSWDGGGTQFTSNSADYHGGVIYASGSNVSWDGIDTQFNSNFAASYGGAIYASGSNVSWDGDDTRFSSNFANDSAGAIYATRSNVSWDGAGTNFSSNSANRDGGAIYAHLSSIVSWAGAGTQFSSNSAGTNGGAIAMYDSTILADGVTNISLNTAIGGAGGGVYGSVSVISFGRLNFVDNEAVWGGGVALFSSGLPLDEDEPDDPGPSKFTTCFFARNHAVDGGGMYSAAGYDMITDSRFSDNFAGGSGGAYLHSGVLVKLTGTTFVRNVAGDVGVAVQSLGIAENISDTIFEYNTKYCAPGEYGYDADFKDEGCRFEVVCSGCASSCADVPESVDVLSNSVPICEAVMTGVNSGNGGMTLSTLNLDRGYYRTSSESQNVLKCHQEDACIGGAETSQYCEEGYRGAYCAVCDEGYASGYQYSCSSCVGENKRSAVGTSVALFLVALVVIALVIVELVRVVDDSNANTRFIWSKRLTSCRDRMVNVVPLTSIKIVLVAWQIVTQFSSVVNVVYPDVYQRFLSALNLFNFNLDFIVSISCVFDTNFYGRLFVATLGPLVVLGALAATYTVSRSRNRRSPAGMQAVKHKHLSIALFFVFVVYSSVSFTIFQTFACETLDNGMGYLRADYSLTCSTGAHTAMKVYAGLMVFVYPIGIPAVFAWWLISNRDDLLKVGAPGATSEKAKTLGHLQPMRDLWAPYKPNRYYFEVVECGRRIALTGLAVFLMPGTAAQAALEVVLAAIFIQVSAKLSPFVDPLDEWLYGAGTWIVFFSMFLALLLKVDASAEDSQSQKVFAKLLIAAHVGMILMVVIQAVLSVRRGLVTVRDQPAANRSFRGSNFARGRAAEAGAVVTSESEPRVARNREADGTATKEKGRWDYSRRSGNVP